MLGMRCHPCRRLVSSVTHRTATSISKICVYAPVTCARSPLGTSIETPDKTLIFSRLRKRCLSRRRTGHAPCLPWRVERRQNDIYRHRYSHRRYRSGIAQGPTHTQGTVWKHLLLTLSRRRPSSFASCSPSPSPVPWLFVPAAGMDHSCEAPDYMLESWNHGRSRRPYAWWADPARSATY